MAVAESSELTIRIDYANIGCATNIFHLFDGFITRMFGSCIPIYPGRNHLTHYHGGRDSIWNPD